MVEIEKRQKKIIMFDKLRDKLQDKRDDFKENRLEFQDNVANRFGFNSTQNAPASNGTGSARGNFGEFAQNTIGRIRQGGMALFGDNNNQAADNQAADPNAAQMMTNDRSSAPCPPTSQGPMPTSQVRQWNPTTGASASAKKIAKKAAKQYVAENRLTGDEAKEVVKNAKKTQSFSKEVNPHADRKAGGAKNKNVDFGGSMNGGPGDEIKKPTANIMKSESTSVAKPIGWGHEQLKTDAITDHVLGMRDMGFYSDKYAMDRIAGKKGYPASTYETVRHPGADSTALEKTIAKGPKKEPKLFEFNVAPLRTDKATRTVKKLEPKGKLMETKTVAKLKKKPLQKMTPRPAKKL